MKDRNFQPEIFSVAGVCALCLVITEVAIVWTCKSFGPNYYTGIAASSPGWVLVPAMMLLFPIVAVLVFAYFFVRAFGIAAFLGTGQTLPMLVKAMEREMGKYLQLTNEKTRELGDYIYGIKNIIESRRKNGV